jgi:hypothetical protein
VMRHGSEWLTNQHRDSYATHIGHHDQLAFFAVAQNDAVGRVRYQLLEVSRELHDLNGSGNLWKSMTGRGGRAGGVLGLGGISASVPM